MRVVVIGAGVVGAAVAVGLAERGAEVTVLEAVRPGAGTTGTSFAWVNSANKEPEHYHALNHAGVRAHHAFAGERAPWFFPTGNLEWAVTDRHRSALAARMERLHGRDYPARWLTARQAQELEPDLAVPGDDADYAFFPEEGHALPLVLLARLLGEARDRGVQVRAGSAVVGVDRTGAGAVVTSVDGVRHPADVVVSCSGRRTDGMARWAGIDVPLVDANRAGSAAVGFLATTEPVAVRLSRVLTGSRLGVRPEGGGRLLLQGLDLDARADPGRPVDGAVAAELLVRLAEVLPATAGVPMAALRIGQRVLPADGLTVAGFSDRDAWFYVVATHSGITLAPLLRRLVADEVFGEESALLTPFRPGRFRDGAGAVAQPARQPGEQ
ncbi:NAD(P)/FAD-dependent oxidoreductase [Pseudonocardia xinjiangensis]|uniref:FAD-binding oxidoreductase n=1 Tax=Pseudonocardia xinjiangensis TaxID=75289 RepID=A0ABX1RJQ6_9PSEU|nr:FAD-binding oxidoreductase [Pseudonocardia xinjiangensis]NMH80613.1 FAD-binding oxidoreductase [Pseudonocardia xinjiangensis]